MSTKKPSRKPSIRRSAFYDQVIAFLESEKGWEPIKRLMARDMVEAVVNTLISNSVTAKGCTLPGFGKLYFRYRKPRRAGTRPNPFNKEEIIKVKARPAMWVPKMRLVKAAKIELQKLAPKTA